MKNKLKSFTWKTWLGVALLLASLTMTIVAPITGLAKSIPYNVLLSHVALVLVALDMIWTSRADEKKADE